MIKKEEMKTRIERKAAGWYCMGFIILRQTSSSSKGIANRIGLSEGETLPLRFFLEGPSALNPRLLLLEFVALAIELLLHFAVTGIQLFFALLQLRLLLGHLLLEDHLHLGLHLGKLLFVEGTFFLLLDRRVDLLEDTRVLRNTHGDELVGAIVLVEVVVGVFLEFLHVGADKHLAELDEVAVFFVVHLNNAPGVATTTDLAAIGRGDLISSTNNGERHLGEDLVVLGNGLLVIELISGTLEDLNLVELDICQDLREPRQPS